jgi:hypothetical protein
MLSFGQFYEVTNKSSSVNTCRYNQTQLVLHMSLYSRVVRHFGQSPSSAQLSSAQLPQLTSAQLNSSPSLKLWCN